MFESYDGILLESEIRSIGEIRTTTLRAFTEEEIPGILGKLPLFALPETDQNLLQQPLPPRKNPKSRLCIS